MKIALVSSGSGYKGGGEIYLQFLANALVDQGHQITVLIPANENMDMLATKLMGRKQIDVRRFDYRSTYTRRLRSIASVFALRQQRRICLYFKRLDVDVLHINQQVLEDGLDLVVAAKRSGKPWLSTAHVGHSAKFLGALLGTVRDLFAERVFNGFHATVLAVSDASAIQLRQRVSGDVFVVQNGVPAPTPTELEFARKQARIDWNAEDDEIVIGAVGRIEYQKNPTAIIDMIEPFDKQGKKIKLVWIGDGSMREELQSLAKEKLSVTPLIIDGWRDDAATRVAGFDLFLLPSRFEGLPLALLEAMHAGLPIVASRADGISEAVLDKETGFLCETDGDWAQGISQLIGDQSLRLQMGQKARRRALESFSDLVMAKNTAKVYRRLLGNEPE